MLIEQKYLAVGFLLFGGDQPTMAVELLLSQTQSISGMEIPLINYKCSNMRL